MTLNEKRSERKKIFEQMKALNDLSITENRELTAEENAKWTKMNADVDRLKGEIDAEEQRMLKLKEIEDGYRTTATPTEIRSEIKTDGANPQLRAIRSYLSATDNGQLSAAYAEIRALQMDSDTAGGYTVLPQQFVTDLIKDVDNQVFVRGLATKYTVTNAESLGAPALDADPADPTWTSELLIGSADSTMAYGKRELRPHPLAQYILVSKKLIRATALGVENLVRQRLAYKAAVVQENAFLNGTGSNQPLGVFAAPTGFGITTSRDVSTGNTDTAIGADGLIEAKYSIKGQYWPRCRWIFSREAVKNIRKLKDGEGQYLWRAGLQGDSGDTILDVPVLMSEYVPHVFTTGLYVGIIGDFSQYWIADALGMEIQVLVELGAATNQNYYILRAETDGMPVQENAFARVTLA